MAQAQGGTVDHKHRFHCHAIETFKEDAATYHSGRPSNNGSDHVTVRNISLIKTHGAMLTLAGIPLHQFVAYALFACPEPVCLSRMDGCGGSVQMDISALRIKRQFAGFIGHNWSLLVNFLPRFPIPFCISRW